MAWSLAGLGRLDGAGGISEKASYCGMEHAEGPRSLTYVSGAPDP
jgi:hypothetical protein